MHIEGLIDLFGQENWSDFFIKEDVDGLIREPETLTIWAKKDFQKFDLSRQLFEEFYARVTPEQPTIDYAGSKLKRWVDYSDTGYLGMVSKHHDNDFDPE